MYYETGGGIIGAGEHKKVRKLSLDLVRSADKYIKYCTKTKDFPLPKANEVYFYIITADGVLTFKTTEKEMVDKKANLSTLFYKGNYVLTAIRDITEEKRM
ncbi:MAG: hypothetical protein LLG37_03355 [Spirochaetia bacterium]|nr:hypothetical protein [Spirochaetia bacterium]